MINQKKKDLKDIQRYYQKAMDLVSDFQEKIKQSQDIIQKIDQQLASSPDRRQQQALLKVQVAHKEYIQSTLDKINPNIEKLKIVASRIEILQAELEALKPKKNQSTPSA